MSKSMTNFNYTKEKRIAWIVTGKQAKPILINENIILFSLAKLVFLFVGEV